MARRILTSSPRTWRRRLAVFAAAICSIGVAAPLLQQTAADADVTSVGIAASSSGAPAYGAGNTGATWTATFTPTVGLTTGDSVTVTFPSGFDVSGASYAGIGGGLSCMFAVPTVSSDNTLHTVTFGLTACTAIASLPATVSVTGLSPTAGSYPASGFSVATDQETTAVPPSAGVTITAATSPSSVTFASSTTAAGANATWTVDFTTSGSGALSAGSTIDVVFPNDFSFIGSPAVAFLTGFGGTCSAGVGSVASEDVQLLLTGSCVLAAGQAAVVTVSGVVNGAVNGSDTGQVYTSADTTAWTSATFSVTVATSATAVSFSGDSMVAHATGTTWTVGFKPSATGALSGNAGDSLTATFPTGFTVPAGPTVTFFSGFSGTCGSTTGSASGQAVTVTLPSGCSLAALQAATVQIAGLTNPTAGSSDTGSVVTSQDSASVTSSSFAITAAATAVTSVSFSSSSMTTGATNTTWNVQFTTSATGALAGSAGDTITVTFPSAFTLPASPTVTFVGFSGTCASTTGLTSSSAVTVALPSGCSLAGLHGATVEIAGITNPATSSASLVGSVSTTQDSALASSTSFAVSNPPLPAPGPQTPTFTWAGQSAPPSVGFVSGSVALVIANAYGAVTVTATSTACQATQNGDDLHYTVSFALPGTCSVSVSAGGTSSYLAYNTTLGAVPVILPPILDVSGSETFGQGAATFTYVGDTHFGAAPPTWLTFGGSLSCSTVSDAKGASHPVGPALAIGNYSISASSCSGLTVADANDPSIRVPAVQFFSGGTFVVRAPSSVTVSVSATEIWKGPISFSYVQHDVPAGVTFRGSPSCAEVKGSILSIERQGFAAGVYTLSPETCSGLTASDANNDPISVNYTAASDSFQVELPVTVTGSQTYGGSNRGWTLGGSRAGLILNSLACGSITGGDRITDSLAAGSYKIDASSCSVHLSTAGTVPGRVGTSVPPAVTGGAFVVNKALVPLQVSGTQVFGEPASYKVVFSSLGAAATSKMSAGGLSCTQVTNGSSRSAVGPRLPLNTYQLVGSTCSGTISGLDGSYLPEISGQITVVPVIEVVGSQTYGSAPTFSASTPGGLPSGDHLVTTNVTCSKGTSPDNSTVGIGGNYLAAGRYTIDPSSCTGIAVRGPGGLVSVARNGAALVVSPYTLALTGSGGARFESTTAGFAVTPTRSLPTWLGASTVSSVSCTSTTAGAISGLSVGDYTVDGSTCTSDLTLKTGKLTSPPTTLADLALQVTAGLTITPLPAVVTVLGGQYYGPGEAAKYTWTAPAAAGVSGTLVCEIGATLVDANVDVFERYPVPGVQPKDFAYGSVADVWNALTTSAQHLKYADPGAFVPGTTTIRSAIDTATCTGLSSLHGNYQLSYETRSGPYSSAEFTSAEAFEGGWSGVPKIDLDSLLDAYGT